jgi:hypothetical protein
MAEVGYCEVIVHVERLTESLNAKRDDSFNDLWRETTYKACTLDLEKVVFLQPKKVPW